MRKLNSYDCPCAGMKNLKFILYDGKVCYGYYDFDEKSQRRWFDEEGNQYESGDVYAWETLKEDKHRNSTEVVIKIPNEIYEGCVKGRLLDTSIDIIIGAIVNGIILPETHGRLIDEDEVNEGAENIIASDNNIPERYKTEMIENAHILKSYMELYGHTIVPMRGVE